MKVWKFALALLLGASLCAVSARAAIVIDNFDGGVTHVSHPNDPGPPASGVWYDITNDSFGTAAGGTLNSSPALLITDGGFTNGVYAIYDAVVPVSGLYNVSADIDVTEANDALNGIRAYQLGVIANGSHRGANPSDLATVTGPGTAVGNFIGLTEGDDNALPTQSVVTSNFFANAGDNLVIAFSTDVDSGDFDSNSAGWTTSSVLVDNLMLNRVIPEPSSLALVGLAMAGLFGLRRRKY